MHVALVHMRSARQGGTENYLNQVARHLCGRGHEVTVVCRSHEDAPDPRVRFLVLRSFAPGAALRVLLFARDVERHLRTTSYDLVVGLGRTWSQDVLRLSGGCHRTYLERAGESSSRRWSPFPRGLSLKDRAILSIEARALRPGAARCVIVNSDLVQRDVVERYGLDPGVFRLIRNGVDLEKFHPRHREASGRALRGELRIGAEEPVVLFLGSNYGRKGLGVLLDAFPAVRRERPGAKLLVVGADPDLAGWKRRARSLGLEDAVLFLGKRSDTGACYGAADLYALPTRYDSFAYTVLESLACGIPVVVSDAAGAAEVVDPACGAVLSSDAGPELFARALAAWLAPGRAPNAATAARRIAEANGAEAAAEKTTALFEELAAEPASARPLP